MASYKRQNKSSWHCNGGAELVNDLVLIVLFHHLFVISIFLALLIGEFWCHWIEVSCVITTLGILLVIGIYIYIYFYICTSMKKISLKKICNKSLRNFNFCLTYKNIYTQKDFAKRSITHVYLENDANKCCILITTYYNGIKYNNASTLNHQIISITLWQWWVSD